MGGSELFSHTFSSAIIIHDILYFKENHMKTLKNYFSGKHKYNSLLKSFPCYDILQISAYLKVTYL